MIFHILGRRSRVRAFTLIELLVVISIISMLSSVVLVAVQGARAKGQVGAALTFATTNFHAFGADAAIYWNFNEASGNALDASPGGYGIQGVLNNGTNITRSSDTPNGSGSSISLNVPTIGSTGDYVSAASLSILNYLDLSADNFTASAWIKPIEGNSVYYVIDGLGASTRPFFIYINNYILYIGGTSNNNSVNYGGNNSGNTGVSVQVNVWQHIAVTYNGSKYSFYLNGKPASISLPATLLSADKRLQALYVGRYGGSAANFFKGYIDDVAVYTHSLSAAEVERLYAAGAVEHGLAAR